LRELKWEPQLKSWGFLFEGVLVYLDIKTYVTMKQFFKKYASLSIVINCLSIVLTLIHNYNLYTSYQEATGKTRALFGIQEYLLLINKIGIGLLLFVSLILLFKAYKNKDNIGIRLIALLTLLFAIVFLLLRPWTYLVD